MRPPSVNALDKHHDPKVARAIIQAKTTVLFYTQKNAMSLMRNLNTHAGQQPIQRLETAACTSLKKGSSRYFVLDAVSGIRAAGSTLKTSFSTIIRWLTALTTFLLASCGGDISYPVGWPPLTSKPGLSLHSHNCPDVNGLYAYDSMQYDESAFEILSTVLGIGVEEESGARWSLITITGDADKALSIKFEGAGPRTEEQSGNAITKTVNVQRGTHYKCDGGWLVGEPQPMSLIGMNRASIGKFQRNYERGNERKNERYPTRLVGLQTARLCLDNSGSLVARADVREAREFSIWPGTRGIKYWVDVTPHWTRWQNEGDAPGTKISPQVMARVEREAYEKENGVSLPASATPATTASTRSVNTPTPALIVLPAKPVEPTAPLATVSGRDLQALLQNISDRASLEGVTRNGERIVVRVHFTDIAQITSTIKSLNESGAFADIQRDNMTTGSGKNGIATISMKQR